MARKARIKSQSGIYHILVRSCESRAIFASADDKAMFLQLLQEYKAISGYQLYGYSLLDDHAHFLMKEGQETIAQVMKRITVKYARWYQAQHQVAGRIFYDRFKSEPIEAAEEVLNVLRYIQQEPLYYSASTEVSRCAWTSFRAYLDQSSLLDTAYCLSLLAAEPVRQKILFQKFMSEPAVGKYLELIRPRLSAQEVKSLLCRLAGIRQAADFRLLKTAVRADILGKMKKIEGVSLAALAEATGLSASTVSRLSQNCTGGVSRKNCCCDRLTTAVN